MVSFTSEDCSRLRAKGNAEPWSQSVKDWIYPLLEKVETIGDDFIVAEYSGPVEIALHVSQAHQASSKGAIAARQVFCDIYPAKSPINRSIKMSEHYSMQIYFRLTRFGGEVGFCWGAWKWQGTKSEMTNLYEESRDYIRDRLLSIPEEISSKLETDVSTSGYRYVDSWSEGGSENTFSGLSEWLKSACSDKGSSHAIIKTFHPWEMEDLGEEIGDVVRRAVEIFSPIFTHVHYDPDAPQIELGIDDTSGNKLGKSYKKSDEESESTYSSPIETNPDAIDRANNSHSKLQNSLAKFVRDAGYKPLSPDMPRTPNFDLAWYVGGRIYVTEVKSITDDNEESQLRHGLGQVLHYKMQLIESGQEAIAVLAVERKPPEIWEKVCEMVNVILVWPGEFKRCFKG